LIIFFNWQDLIEFNSFFVVVEIEASELIYHLKMI